MASEKVLMQCGCVATGIRQSDGKPVCVSHSGIHPGYDKPVETKPSLEGRKAHCAYGSHAVVDSSYDLPFFEYRPQCEQDIYYCGCFGWD